MEPEEINAIVLLTNREVMSARRIRKKYKFCCLFYVRIMFQLGKRRFLTLFEEMEYVSYRFFQTFAVLINTVLRSIYVFY